MKKQITLIFSLLLCISLSQTFLTAQISFSEPVQPSPTAAGLGKFGDFPVSHHTGVPNISIPIYSLQEGPIGLSISLSYHASGIRVDEVAPWTGLGWTLQAGGAITQSIMGSPDQGGTSGEGSAQTGGITDRRGWYQAYGMPPMIRDAYCYNNPVTTYEPNTFNDCAEYYLDAANGHLDSRPDMFSFNFGGMSGKFMFDDERKLRIIKEDNVRIEPLNDDLSEWKAIGPDGTKYFFGGNTATEKTYNAGNGVNPTADYNLSTITYYLYKIESANNDHCISITYDSEKYAFPNRVGHTVNIPSSQAVSAGQSYPGVNEFTNASEILSLTSVDGKRISGITCSSGLTEIIFVPGSTRTDLNKYASLSAINDECKSLDRIDIIKGTNTKSFELSYGYFDSGSSGLPNNSPGWVNYDRTRLKLLSVKEKSGIDEIPPYNFTYNETTAMPRRLSLARDYWGYYNGADNNTGLLPAGIPKKSVDITQTWDTNSDREPDTAKMKAWIIRTVQFPTGGLSTFSFEGHVESINNKIVGGLRIKKIHSNPGSADPPLVRTYNYIGGNLYGIYPDPANYSIEISTQNYSYFPAGVIALTTAEVLTADPPSSLIALHGNHIGYFTVEEDRGNNGKTVYHFNNATPIPIIGGGPSYPNIPLQTDLQTGTMNRMEQYDESGNLIQETIYNYVEVDKGRIEARVVNLQGAVEDWTGSNPNFYSVVLVRDFEIKYGRWELHSTSQTIDGVTTLTEQTDYIDQHTLPKKTRITDSDNNIQETISSYSFDFANIESACASSYESCRSTFFTEMNTLRSTYVDQATQTVSDPTGYENGMEAAQNTFLSCVQSSISTQSTCQVNYLNSLAAETKAMLERNMLLPLEITSKHNSFTTGGTKADYALINLDPNKDDFLLANKFYKLEVQPDGSSTNWEEEVQVQYDDHGNVLQNKHPDSEEVAYIYGFNQVLPTAKVSPAAIDEVAYSSFEFQTLNAVDHGSWVISNPSTIVTQNINSTLIAGASTSHPRTLESHDGSNISVDFTATMPSGFFADLRIVDQNSGADWTYSFSNGESTTFQLPPGQYQFTMIDCESGSGNSCGVADGVTLNYDFDNTSNIYTGFNHSKPGKTGEKAFLLSSNNSISRTGLPAGDYVVSYFSQNGTFSLGLSGGASSLGNITYQGSGDGWALVEEKISIPGTGASITLTGSGFIDELRLHPKHALMTTYSYDAELRVHAVNGPNNRPVIYIYDDLGRLTEVLDHNGNLRSLTEYNYAN